MANMQKYTRGAIGHLFKHYERGLDDNGEYVKFGNTSIDLERTHLNYSLKSGSAMKNYLDRMDEVKCLKRADVNVMCSWIVTIPQDLKDTEYEDDFFKKTYSFLCDRYGEQNVVSANVHKDETTPHLHFAFIPVLTDEKGIEKVCAKKVCCKTDLQTFHKDLKKHLESELGIEVAILNGATENVNKTILELKNKSLEEQNKALDDEIRLKSDELRAITKERDKMDAQLVKGAKKGFLGANVIESAKRVLEKEEKVEEQARENERKEKMSKEFYHEENLKLGKAQYDLNQDKRNFYALVEEKAEEKAKTMLKKANQENAELKYELELAKDILADSLYGSNSALDVFENTLQNSQKALKKAQKGFDR